jgi:hypothetical protein
VSSRSNSLAHTNGRERQCSLAHCGRPRATSPTPTCQHQSTYRMESTQSRHRVRCTREVGAPAHHRQNDDGTMELSSALRCAALARLLLSASALHEIRASYRTARLLSLRSHSRVCLPTPLARCWWSRGRLSGSCAACRRSAHDPKAVQDGQATTQDPQDRASGFLSRPATGARANLASTRDFITFAGATPASQSCWLVLRIGSRDGFDSQL